MSADGKLFDLVLEARDEIFGKAAAGSPFHVYTPATYFGKTTGRTRAYAVAAGQRLSDSWEVDGFENAVCHLRVCGPNGFFREFAGSRSDPPVVISCEYAPVPAGDIVIHAAGGIGGQNYTLRITDHISKTGNRSITLHGGSKQSVTLRLARSLRWYDFSVTIAGAGTFLRRYAGRVETGQSGFSDPAMA
jgi:phospholipase C